MLRCLAVALLLSAAAAYAQDPVPVPPEPPSPDVVLPDPPLPLPVEPKLVVNGPTKVTQPGLIILDASQSKADFVEWYVDISGISLTQNDDEEQNEADAESLRSRGYKIVAPVGGGPVIYAVRGSELFLSQNRGTYRGLLIGHNGGAIRFAPWSVEVAIGGDPPPDKPPPPDNPPPPPTGIVTDLSAQARQWLATVPVKSQSPKADVAAALREIETANPPLGITEMELFLGISLPLAIGEKLADWASFSTSANTALQKLKSQGATADQYRAAIKSIAAVLE